jgi:hypothetical protein
MPYFSVLGRLKPDWPIYNSKPATDFGSRRDMRLSEMAIRYFHQPSFLLLWEIRENNG